LITTKGPKSILFPNSSNYSWLKHTGCYEYVEDVRNQNVDKETELQGVFQK